MTDSTLDYTVPAGMTVVTQDEFFSALKADNRDIMPNNDSPTFTVWEDRQRRVFGRTLPGWKNPGDRSVYMLAKSA
jgi:hypothetical protein